MYGMKNKKRAADEKVLASSIPASLKWNNCLIAVSASVKIRLATSLYCPSSHWNWTRASTRFFSWLDQSCISVGLSVHLFHIRGNTNETTETRILTRITSTTRLFFEILTLFILQIVRFSFAALKTAPTSPPRQPIIMKLMFSHIAKFDASPVKLLNSPKEKSLSIFACPHALSRFLSPKSVPSVHMAQKKHLQVNLVLQ
mmetsp:Transcript_9017/g.13650  ORF Transcript_9017/g.13650 Transcript_9017/m.13650 type:complete len:200 (+) Transcript_9017:79-678(+)